MTTQTRGSRQRGQRMASESGSVSRPTSLLTLSVGGRLQRACACGQHTSGGAECEECNKKRIEAGTAAGGILSRNTSGSSRAALPFVRGVLKSPVQSVDTSARESFELGFGQDFSAMRVLSLERTLPSNVEDASFSSTESSRSVLQIDAGTPAPPSPATGAAAADAPRAAIAPAFPSAAFARFVTAGAIRCCRAAGAAGCPTHLGPSVAGDARDQNGMNLTFAITGHRPTVEYGFVQVISSVSCDRASAALGGAWTMVDHDPAGTDDSPIAEATCTRPNAADEITMADAPGFQTPLGGGTRPGVDEMSLRMNATDWIIARELPGGWRKISDFFGWHTINRIRRNGAGNWELVPAGSRIGRGYVGLGGCPPP